MHVCGKACRPRLCRVLIPQILAVNTRMNSLRLTLYISQSISLPHTDLAGLEGQLSIFARPSCMELGQNLRYQKTSGDLQIHQQQLFASFQPTRLVTSYKPTKIIKGSPLVGSFAGDPNGSRSKISKSHGIQSQATCRTSAGAPSEQPLGPYRGTWI